MSVAADSPLTSSSSDDFVEFEAYLEDELNSEPFDASPNQGNDDDDVEEEEDSEEDSAQRVKRLKVDLESNHEAEGTSYESVDHNGESQINDSCSHPGFIRDMCIRCGKKTDDVAGVSLGYIHKDLRIANDEITRLRDADVKKMFQKKKLYLVLDLDHTLLNSTRIQDISPDEEYLLSQTHSLQDISNGNLFRLDMIRMVTKLRPYVRTFLKEASELFEMYIYTMGEQPYAIEMANLLDPGKLYFESRVISQADCTQKHQKGLDVVLGLDSAVLILDDTEAVWQKHKDNLILMERYHYFSSSCRQFGFNVKSLSELKSDENEADGALATVLGVLRRVHAMFFDPERKDDIAGGDVREMLKAIKKEILNGCKIVFSRVFPNNCRPNDTFFWKMAESLGATCCTELDPSVTHVISYDTGTDKSRWANKEKKFLVHPKWIEAANYFWKRQPEDKFRVETKQQ